MYALESVIRKKLIKFLVNSGEDLKLMVFKGCSLQTTKLMILLFKRTTFESCLALKARELCGTTDIDHYEVYHVSKVKYLNLGKGYGSQKAENNGSMRKLPSQKYTINEFN